MKTCGVIVLFLVVASVGAQRSRRDRIDPRTIVSPSGQAMVWINPSDPTGKGSGSYRVTLGGKIAWEKQLPFTLINAKITDEGLVAGYAYTEGDWGTGDFLVAIIDPSGHIRLKERTKRTSSRYLHTDPDPKSSGMILDPANDRLLLRIIGADVNRGVETWWIYSLSDGKRLADAYPEGVERTLGTWIFDVKPVPGTPLLISSWQFMDSHSQMSQRFVLMDYSGKPIWKHDLPGDFVSSSTNERDRWNVRQNAFDHGTIFLGSKPRQFDLRFMRESKIATFECTSSGSGWSVREIGRRNYEPPKPKPKEDAPELQVAEVELSITSKVTLPIIKEPVSDVTNVGPFCVVDGGLIAFVCYESPTYLRVVNQAGKLVRKVTLPARARADQTELFLTRSGKSQLVLVAAASGVDPRSRAWRVNVLAGTVVELTEFTSFQPKAVAAMADGRFAVLAIERKTYTFTDHVTFHKPDGTVEWRVVEENGTGGGEHELLSPCDLDFTPKGELAVLDGVQGALLFFGPKGKFLRRINLEQKAKRIPMSPTDVTCLPDGRLFIYDFALNKPGLLLTSSGQFIREFSPTHPSGKTFHVNTPSQIDPQGNLWVTNRTSILRIDEKGRVARTVGNPLRESGLGWLGDLQITADGQIYALDGVTSAIHGFDATGKSTFVTKPGPTEFTEAGLISPDLIVTLSGEFYVSGSTPSYLIHYSPAGQRLDYVYHASESVQSPPIPPPPFVAKPTYRWYGEVLLDEKARPVATMTRWPDQEWMNGPSAIAPDGRLMSFQTATSPKRGRLAFFSADGLPDGLVELPVGLHTVSRSMAAFDGERSYFVTVAGLVAIDRKGQALWRYRPKGWTSDWKVFATRRGLALYDGGGTVSWVKP